MTLAGDTARRLLKNKMGMAGLLVVAALFFVAIFADRLAPYPPDRTDTAHILDPPTWAHYMGTDVLGRDVLS